MYGICLYIRLKLGAKSDEIDIYQNSNILQNTMYIFQTYRRKVVRIGCTGISINHQLYSRFEQIIMGVQDLRNFPKIRDLLNPTLAENETR